MNHRKKMSKLYGRHRGNWSNQTVQQRLRGWVRAIWDWTIEHPPKTITIDQLNEIFLNEPHHQSD